MINKDLSGSIHPLQLTHPLDDISHPVVSYLSQLSPQSVFVMRRNLDAIAFFLTDGVCDALSLDWGKLTYHHTRTLRNWLSDKYAPATANQMLTALRRVLSEAKLMNLMTDQSWSNATAIKNVKDHSCELTGRALSRSEIRALFKSCREDDSIIGIRDAALLAILISAGPRRTEAINLNLSDYDRSPAQGNRI
ncbi:integrase/recombinase (plasmid) [Gloeothece citriformis PCC 7424]|uniref:Integrase/recombinase n=1 Tax=Gloeothece citriformis (strain PCC 7424) TaxID=65393 RepID=B7KLN5_GLOC7|nr:integrase/recombinase [Gloeothece citriformis]ACK73707.1 integrase/recombinase [Gloeothece citriformis PCC 7424]